MGRTMVEQRDPRWWQGVVLGVLLGALALRLTAAGSTPFIGDELDLLYFARGAGSAGAGGTPIRALKHPPLALLVMRLPVTMGLDTAFDVRLPFVLLSVVGLAFAYLLARRGFGRWPALIALVLLSVDQFHLIRSRAATEAVALAFVAPILYAFYRAVKDDRPGLLVVAALLVGVGYYGKEDTLLLVPAMGLFLLAKRSRCRWFRRKELYLALVIVAALVSMNVSFNATGASSNLSRISDRTAGVGLTLRATSLYLGELFIRLVDNPAEFVWVQDRWSWEVPAMNWVAGLVCLAAAIYATGRYRDELTSLLLWVFWVVFATASVVAPTHGFFELDLKKWAGASLIPAAILAGDLIRRRTRRWRPGQVLAAVLIGFLIGNGIRISLVRDNVYSIPPEAAQMRHLMRRAERP